MKYPGTIRNNKGILQMPDGFLQTGSCETCEAVEIGKDIILVANPLDGRRLETIDQSARKSIDGRRDTLNGLAR